MLLTDTAGQPEVADGCLGEATLGVNVKQNCVLAVCVLSKTWASGSGVHQNSPAGRGVPAAAAAASLLPGATAPAVLLQQQALLWGAGCCCPDKPLLLLLL